MFIEVVRKRVIQWIFDVVKIEGSILVLCRQKCTCRLFQRMNEPFTKLCMASLGSKFCIEKMLKLSQRLGFCQTWFHLEGTPLCNEGTRERCWTHSHWSLLFRRRHDRWFAREKQGYVLQNRLQLRLRWITHDASVRVQAKEIALLDPFVSHQFPQLEP